MVNNTGVPEPAKSGSTRFRDLDPSTRVVLLVLLVVAVLCIGPIIIRGLIEAAEWVGTWWAWGLRR